MNCGSVESLGTGSKSSGAWERRAVKDRRNWERFCDNPKLVGGGANGIRRKENDGGKCDEGRNGAGERLGKREKGCEGEVGEGDEGDGR